MFVMGDHRLKFSQRAVLGFFGDVSWLRYAHKASSMFQRDGGRPFLPLQHLLALQLAVLEGQTGVFQMHIATFSIPPAGL